MKIGMVDETTKGTCIKVVGVGGAGGNAVRHMIDNNVAGVEFIAINTDAQALEISSAKTILQLGESGLGAGMRPDIGKELAEGAREKIKEVLEGAHMVFIAAGMGGGTGTGASPVVAQVARELGALTVAVVTKPFSYEGPKCMKVAEDGLEELNGSVDSLIVVLNEKLEEMYEDDTMRQWLEHADDILKNAVAGIAEVINVPGLMNVDFNDVKTIMQEQGKAMMGMATASGVDRARLAAEQAIDSPLLDGKSIVGAKAVLVNVSGNAGLKGKEVQEVNNTIRQFADEDAMVCCGMILDESLGDEIRVTVIATGLDQAQKKPVLISSRETVLKTGTDDVSAVAAPQNTQPASSDAALEALTSPARPSVWRRPTSGAAGGITAGTKNSSSLVTLDDLVKGNDAELASIPSFIRKQAD